VRTLTIGCVLSLILTLGCATTSQRINRVDVPATLGSSSAVAYRFAGQDGSSYAEVRLPLTPDLQKAASDTGLLLLAYANGRYWVVPHRIDGDAVVANVTTGVYVISAQPAIPIARALDIICHIQGLTLDKGATVRQTFLPKICTQILCAPGFMTQQEFVAQYPELDLEGVAPGGVGGWTAPPQDICSMCTSSGRWTADFTMPTIQCVSGGGGPGCSGGTLLFNDNFEADTLNAVPGTPSGLPLDDSVGSVGSVLVTTVAAFGNSKAVHLARGGLAGVKFDAVLGAGATPTAAYCISFRIAVEAGAAPVEMTLLSANNLAAWRLSLGDDGWQLFTGGVPLDLPAALVGTAPHQLRFDLDLTARRVNLVVDGTAVATGLPLLNTGFTTPARVRFSYYPTIIEALPGRCAIDDLQVRKN
jgi:hypothetical protein